MLIELEQQKDVCVVRLSGRLVSGIGAAYLHEKLVEIKSTGSEKVLVDMRELESIGSIGIGFLADVYTSVMKNPGSRFVLAAPRRRVLEVLELTHLNTVMPVVADVASAMALLQQNAAATTV